MGFLAVFKVRGSGLTNKTTVDVLEALAFFLNEKTGACFPSTESIAKVARVHPNVARKTLKELEDSGLITSNQKPGCKRHFVLHLERLPLQEITWGDDPTGVKDVEPTPLKIINPSPLTCLSTPLKEVKPELEIELEINKEKGTRNVVPAPASDDLFPDATEMIEEKKPKKSRAKPKTQCPFSPDEQIPDDYLAYAKEKHPSIDALKEFRKFVNSAYANGRKYSDWKAAWRTWTANAEDWKPKTTYTPRNNAPLRFDDAYYGDGSF